MTIRITLIDDFSNDNSSKIIKSIKNFDSRIKIIENRKNMGSLYSRSIGVLLSRGEYIFPLDNDDMFFAGDTFDTILKIARNNNLDIVGFRGFAIRNYKDSIKKIKDLYHYRHYLENRIIHQPELGSWMINIRGKFHIHDVTVWAKCIKSKIYKKATVVLGKKRYSNFVSWAEDTIINFVIFNIAGSFIFIRKYGIIHLDNFSTASFSMPKDIKIFGELFFMDVIYDFSKNNYDKNYAVLDLYRLKRKFKIHKSINNRNIIYFQSILNKFLKSKYFSNKTKNKIKKDFREFFI